MEREIVDFETAKLAKEKGFDIPCKFYYGKTGIIHRSRQLLTQKSLRGSDESCLAPTQKVFKNWIEENSNITAPQG